MDLLGLRLWLDERELSVVIFLLFLLWVAEVILPLHRWVVEEVFVGLSLNKEFGVLGREDVPQRVQHFLCVLMGLAVPVDALYHHVALVGFQLATKAQVLREFSGHHLLLKSVGYLNERCLKHALLEELLKLIEVNLALGHQGFAQKCIDHTGSFLLVQSNALVNEPHQNSLEGQLLH